MIIEIFALFLALAVIGIVLGYYTGDEFYAFVGLFILFSLSVIILTGNLEYQTGESHSYGYTPGYCADNCTIQTAITGDTVTFSYTSYSDTTSHWIGLVLALASGFGMFLLFSKFKLDKQKRNESEM